MSHATPAWVMAHMCAMTHSYMCHDSQKRPLFPAKEPYLSAKEPYISAKEPSISVKEPYILA